MHSISSVTDSSARRSFAQPLDCKIGCHHGFLIDFFLFRGAVAPSHRLFSTRESCGIFARRPPSGCRTTHITSCKCRRWHAMQGAAAAAVIITVMLRTPPPVRVNESQTHSRLKKQKDAKEDSSSARAPNQVPVVIQCETGATAPLPAASSLMMCCVM